MPNSANINTAQKEIEQILTEFKQLFSTVFFKTAAKQLQSIPPSEAEQIFNELWAKMEAGSALNAKEALDHYFHTIKAETVELKKYEKTAPKTSSSPIAKSCEALSMRLHWLHRSGLMDMFTNMISIYHWLANKRLFLDKVAYYQTLLIELSNANAALQRKHNEIDLVCQPFLQMLKKKGHLLTQPEWSVFEKHPMALIDDQSLQSIEAIERQLACLPTTKKIDNLLVQAKEQNGISDDGRIKAQARSKFLLTVEQDIKRLADKFLSAHKDAPCYEPTYASHLLMSDMTRMTANIGAAAFEIVDVNQDIQALANACRKKGDGETAAKIANWTAINTSLATVHESYTTDYADENAVRAKTLICLIDKIQTENIRHQTLQQKIKASEQLFENSRSCLRDLSEKCEVIASIKPEETIGYFLKRNWGKMLIAGVLAAGLGAGLGFVFIPTILVIAAMAVSGFLLGSSLGLLGGVAAEKIASSSEMTEKDAERLVGFDRARKPIKPSIKLETSVTVVPEPVSVSDQTVEPVNVQNTKAANSVFAFFPSVERVKQSAAMIGEPAPVKYDRQPMQRAM